MITRIVRMAFRPEEVEAFLAIFRASSPQIRSFPGCHHLELHQAPEDASIFFTLSHWDGPEALEAYRQSALFQTTWAQTKVLFREKPQAWSLALHHQVQPPAV